MRFVAIVAALLLLLAPAIAQEKRKAPLTGTWKLVAVIAEKDGKLDEPWGANPQGLLVLDSNGRFSQIQMRSDRPKFQSNNRLKGTDEENRATAQGVLAYYGAYAVDETAVSISFSIESSSFPNQNGTVGKRPYIWDGDDLIIINPAAASGSEIRLRWRRP